MKIVRLFCVLNLLIHKKKHIYTLFKLLDALSSSLKIKKKREKNLKPVKKNKSLRENKEKVIVKILALMQICIPYL